MARYKYLPESEQFRDSETGRFASGMDVIRAGEMEYTDNERFKLKGGPFVSENSVFRRTPEDLPTSGVTIGERMVFVRPGYDVDQIRIYAQDIDHANKATVKEGIEAGIISESEYAEADTMQEAADLVRSRAIFSQSTI